MPLQRRAEKICQSQRPIKMVSRRRGIGASQYLGKTYNVASSPVHDTKRLCSNTKAEKYL